MLVSHQVLPKNSMRAGGHYHYSIIMQLQLRCRVGSPFDEAACLVVVETTKGDIWWTDTVNSPRHHRFVIRLVVNAKVHHRGRALARGHDQCLRMRSTKIARSTKNNGVSCGGEYFMRAGDEKLPFNK